MAAILDEKIFCCHGGKAFVPLLSDRHVMRPCCVVCRPLSRHAVNGADQENHAANRCSRPRLVLHQHCTPCVLNNYCVCVLCAAGLLCDLLWSDPDKETNGWGENDRGVSFTFGPEIVSKFLAKHDMDLICRAHQVLHQVVLALGQETIVPLLLSVALGGGGWL